MIGSVTDWVILAVVVVVLFGGAKKIPELAKAMGKAMGEFRKGQAEIEKEISDMRSSVDQVTNPATDTQRSAASGANTEARQTIDEDREYTRRRISQLEDELRDLKEKAGA